ncbi:hypothetical protein NTE11_003110 [Vibrio fluvialis]|uniref:hypothetical protein n=1 Tax=Vibrio cholerae TaxID=666 RepID=UPI001C9CE66A|nr:hypothetical protein [Vibrio fluvialis]EKO3451856.1 hypothetical protein [Vibrio fluvialis]EKO3461207.1 hypothetical protein [Vibrio fluvialis]ELX7502066.1 hypothetical protein [Vibrio fluvialis]MBY8138790.1 hypothetical protein [Vibrio fluvialis]
MSNEDIIANLTKKLEQAEADKRAAVESHVKAFADEVFNEMLKHYKSLKVLPLTMAGTYLERVNSDEHQ